MSAAEIAAVKEGAGDGLSAFDLQLINAADELLRDKFISAMTWKKLAERYTTLQLMEVVGLVGCYTTMAMVTKTFAIQIEESESTTETLAALRQNPYTTRKEIGRTSRMKKRC